MRRRPGSRSIYELTSVGSLPTRISTITETGSGADVTMIFLLYPFLFADKLLDVSDIAEEAGKKQGGWYDAAKEAGVVNGKWKAVPFSNIGQLMNWRTDWFKEVGVNKFPDTWEELYEVGKKLKAKDHPFGFELGHGFGDNHGWLYPLLWSYGGHEVEPDGKTVVDRFRRDRARRRFRPQILQGHDARRRASAGPMSATTRRGIAEQISCTNNAESILWLAKRDFPEIAKVTDQAHEPAGAEGPLPSDELRSAIRSSTSRPAKEEAHAFLRWLMDEKQLGGWYASADSYYQPLLHGYDNAPMWDVEPRNIPYRDALASAHLPGWPAPPTGQLAESRRQIRRRRHVRQGLRRRLDQGGHQERRGAAERDLPAGVRMRQYRVTALARQSGRTAPHRRAAADVAGQPGRAHDDAALGALSARPAGAAVSLSGWLDRESVFSWLMMAPPLLFLAALVGYPFCLRHPVEPAGPAGRACRHVCRAEELHRPISTTRSSGRSRSTPSSTPPSRRC